tara:strand:- start:20303 stop:20473 length:171 start_codon:yes stop_codon:yes gene_type:complete
VKRFALDAVLGAIPVFLSGRVVDTILADGVGAGLIHFMFCLLLVEVIAQIIEVFVK